jgi:uncharacterized protein YgiM (DUF1202 family)
MASRRFWMLVGAIVALVLILVLALAIGKAIGRKTPTETTRTTTQTTTTATTTLVTPTPTVRPTTTATTTEALPQLRVKARTLNLRQEASKNSTLITTLASGDILTQLEEPAGDWVRVRTDEGMVGYVFYSYVEPYSP